MYLLHARHIGKRYQTSSGPFWALRPCSIRFPDRGLIAIEGKSGSGKSTLLHLLSGIENPSVGNVYYLGKKVSRRALPFVGEYGGMVFQHYNLIDGMSVVDNVALPAKMRGGGKKRALALLASFGLKDLAHRDVKALSGGEKQRVAICRALINDPRVVFADEPTGALDETNSIKVMDALKRISKDRLVIMVSHNRALVDVYADKRLWIEDGKVSGALNASQTKREPKKRKGRRHGWLWTFFWRNLKRNAFKDSMCFLAGMVGFLSLLMGFGYLQGNMPAMEAEQQNTLNYLSAKVSRRSEVHLPGSTLTLVKRTSPSEEETREELSGLGGFELSPDYGYFFPMAMPFRIGEDVKEPCSFCPIWDITLTQHGDTLISRGEKPSGLRFDECVVNEEFIRRYGKECFGEEVVVSQRSTVSFGGKGNEVFVEAKLRLVAVVKEFGFLNVPRVYYSLPLLERHLSTIDLIDENGDSEDIVSFVRTSSEDSPYASYDRLMFLSDPKQVASVYHLIEKGDSDLELTSDAYSLWKSFSSLSSAFVSSLSLFVCLAFIGLALILGMASFSSFVEGKKESALLLVLGAKRGEAFSIYIMESAALCALSAAFSLIFSPFLQRFLNHLLLRQFDVHDLLKMPLGSFLGIPYLVPIALVVGAIIFGLIASVIPIAVNKRISLAEELRDE
ncbi:MAG: ABC transporter ATP-binding protein/permease [Erysipelotrichaceae bacterium]|nr:ABC transporter ATP-binding protein/permease [Erysipelotrichaceae bacterium]